jgi:hypothetical protein
MLGQGKGQNRTWLIVGCIVFLVLAIGTENTTTRAATYGSYAAPNANRTGNSSFIDTSQEYASGNSSSDLGLWYTWINTGDTQVVFLALDYEGLQFMGTTARSPVSMVVGEHFNTSEGEVFVANSPRYMEIYNDTNGNGVPDSNFTAGYSEIQYYVIMNSSESFQPTPVEKQVDGNGTTHYRWSVRYNGIDAILEDPFVSMQHPLITVIIDYAQCSYDYHIIGNSSYLKIGFEVGPFLDPRRLDNNSLVPTNLALNNYSLSILFSTMIVTAKPNYQVTVGGEAYNSTTAKTPVTPIDNATLDLQQSPVYSFLFGENYTLTADSVSNTYTSIAAACSNASVSSPYLVGSAGPLVFSKWGSEAEVIADLVPRLSNSLDVSAVMNQASNFFYRVCYPKWGNETLVHDPTYVANLYPISNLNPRGLGLSDVQVVAVAITAGAGIVMLGAAVLHRKKTPKLTMNERV